MKQILMKLTLILFILFSSILIAPESLQAHTFVAGPTAQKWYFPEGRIGSGFRTFFTIGNPSSNDCAIKVEYFYTFDGSSTNNQKTMPDFTVKANSRYTVNANANIPVSTPATLAAIISVDSGATPTCSGITAERPMYLANFHGISSGTDVFGSTTPGTKFYLADVPTHAAGESFLSILNPGDVSANVSVIYYAGGMQVGQTATITVAPKSRGTIEPNADLNIPAHVGAMISSDHDILVERPSYFVDIYGVSGSADVTAISALSADWYFAEGNTSSGKQENLLIANFGDTDTGMTITLKSLSGATKDFPITVKAHDQTIWNVNSNNSFSGSTSEVAASIHADAATIAVQRQIYGTYSGSNGNQSWSAQEVTDAFGTTMPHNSYSFAEGFASIGFNEWLLLQNPTGAAETINLTISNMLSHSYTASITLSAQSRDTINITQMIVDHLAQSGEDARAYAVSMSLNSSSGFIAERSVYWSAFNTQGGECVVGYSG